MANLRIVNDNAADRATLASNSIGSGFALSSLQNNRKSDFFRSGATSIYISANFAAAETVGMVSLPICNLTPTAQVRVRCYSDSLATTLINDSGTLTPVPAPTQAFNNWVTAPAGGPGFAYGSGTYATVWLSAHVASVMAVRIDITDTSNPQGFIDAARLVVGDYYEVLINPEFNGVEVKPVSASSTIRSDAGDLVTDVGVKSRAMSINLSLMSDSEKNAIINGVTKNWTDYPVFVSLYPGDADKLKERNHSIYGKLDQLSGFKLVNFGLNATSLNILEI